MKSGNRHDLFHCIEETSFYMDDLRLFLDTHPCNQEAIAAFNYYASLRKELEMEYSELYGPLTSYTMNNNCEDWLWVCAPWPWEGEC